MHQSFNSPNKVLSDKARRVFEFLEKVFDGVLQALGDKRVPSLAIRNLGLRGGRHLESHGIQSPYFPDCESEAQGGEVTCSRSRVG